jgi:hypothetical protein
MKNSITDHDEVMLLVNRDVPPLVEADPFEDAITEEMVMLDVVRLDLVDVELL